jgi:PAS domain-containing protein
MSAESLNDLVAEFDDEGLLVCINAAGRRLLGYEPDDDLSQFVLSDFYPETVYEYLLQEAYPEAVRGVWRGRADMRAKGGSTVPTEHYLTVQRTLEGDFATLTVTARRLAAAEGFG